MLNFRLIQAHLSEILTFSGLVKEICTFFGPETNMQNQNHISIFHKIQNLGIKHNKEWCQVNL